MLWLSEWQSPRPCDRCMQTLQRWVRVYLYVPMGPLPSLSSLLSPLLPLSFLSLSLSSASPLFARFDALSHLDRDF